MTRMTPPQRTRAERFLKGVAWSKRRQLESSASRRARRRGSSAAGTSPRWTLQVPKLERRAQGHLPGKEDEEQADDVVHREQRRGRPQPLRGVGREVARAERVREELQEDRGRDQQRGPLLQDDGRPGESASVEERLERDEQGESARGGANPTPARAPGGSGSRRRRRARSSRRARRARRSPRPSPGW